MNVTDTHVAENKAAIDKNIKNKLIKKAILNANKEIEINSIKGLSMTNYFIRRNLELVKSDKKFEAEFIKMYL